MTLLPYCVYVLYSLQDHHLYVGFTTDLEDRLARHHQGRSRSTASRRPLELIFCEYYLAKDDAQRRERYLKSTPGRKALKLMLQRTLEERSSNTGAIRS